MPSFRDSNPPRLPRNPDDAAEGMGASPNAARQEMMKLQKLHKAVRKLTLQFFDEGKLSIKLQPNLNARSHDEVNAPDTPEEQKNQFQPANFLFDKLKKIILIPRKEWAQFSKKIAKFEEPGITNAMAEKTRDHLTRVTKKGKSVLHRDVKNFFTNQISTQTLNFKSQEDEADFFEKVDTLLNKYAPPPHVGPRK